MKISLSEHFTYKKLLRFVLPSVSMMIVTSLYTIVDGFFVSNFVGKNPFAALNLIWPFLTLIGMAGFMIGSGGSALVAFTLGEKKDKKANEIFTMLIIILSIFGVIISAAGFIFMRPISYLLGANEALIDYCVLYGRILISANTFFMLQNAFQSFLITAEKPKLGLAISIAAGFTNVILDFVLVYIFRLGIWGAASATALSQFIGGMIPLIYFLRKNSSRLRLVKCRLEFKMILKACTNGSSEMMTNLSSSIIGLMYNYQLLKIAGENGVAAYGAIMYVSFIFMSLFFGYSMGVTPIVGYHYGAENCDELKNLLKKSLILTAVTGTAMTLLGYFTAWPLAKIYVGYDDVLYNMTAYGMKIFTFSFILSGFNIFASAFFTGLNNGKVSAAISFLRTLVIQVISILALPILFGLNGIWAATIAAEGITIIVTTILFIANRKKYKYF